MPSQTFTIITAPEHPVLRAESIRQILHERYRATEIEVRESAGWHEGYRDGLGRKHQENAEAEIMHKDIADLEAIRNIADDLVGLVSYAEVVGGVTVNRDPIRKLCDEFIKLNRPFKDRAIAEIIGDTTGNKALAGGEES